MSVIPDRSDAGPTSGALLFPPASLGVIGSGQLGRMFIQAAQRMGYRAGVLSEAEDTPAAQVAHWTVIGRDDRLPALRAFCQRADAVTVEFENVSAPGSAGWPAIGRSGPAGGRSGSPRTASVRRPSWPGTTSPTPHGGRCAPRPSSMTPSGRSDCR